MEFRKIFDTIPEKFDKWRPRYCQEAFDCIAEAAQIGPAKSVLEIGPGTGQATDPILRTGCDYMAIELGEHLTEFMRDKYKSCSNFQIVNGDFENYDFGTRKFDLIYSAGTIQWIPEEVAFPRAFGLLKNGGTLAMMMIKGDYESSNKALYDMIQAVYKEFFHPETPYTQKFVYKNAVNYGFDKIECRKFYSTREFTAAQYVEYCGTHCDHLALQEPYRTRFFEGIKSAVLEEGDKIILNDTVTLYLTTKRFTKI